MAKPKKKKVSARKAAPRKAKPASKISAKKSKAARVRASSHPTETLLGRNHAQRKLNPFTRRRQRSLRVWNASGRRRLRRLRSRFRAQPAVTGTGRPLRDRSGAEADRARHLRNLRDVGQTDPACAFGSDPVRALHRSMSVAARKTK